MSTRRIQIALKFRINNNCSANLNFHSLCIIYFNAMGLTNKLDELQTLISDSEPDIIGVSQTHFTKQSPSSVYNLSYYNLYRADRESGSHGGVALYVKSTLTVTSEKVCVDSFGEWESLWCTVMLPSGEHIDVGCYYRIPSIPLPDHWSSFSSALLQCPVSTQRHPTLMFGDFNFPSVDWQNCSTSQSLNSASQQFLNFVQENSLNQSVVCPTRHRYGQRSSLLDLVITTNDVTLSPIKHQAPLGRSDHDILSFSMEVAFSAKSSRNIRINFKKADFLLINDIIDSIDWTEELLGLDVNEQLRLLNTFLQDVIHTFVPTFNLPTAHRPLWLTQDVRALVNKKKRAYRKFKTNPSPTNFSLYKAVRNASVSGIRQAKLNFEEQLVFNSKQQPKLLYSYLNSGKKSQPASCLKNDDHTIVTDDQEIANKFNSFFASNFSASVRYNPHRLPAQGIVTFNLTDVEEALKHLKEGTSGGADDLPAFFLKSCSKSLALPFFIVFSTSVETCTFPTCWKDANISPILKSGSPITVNNYRPVSLLPICSKILERLIYKQILSYCHDLSILNESQHGFLQGRSCLTNLLCTYDEVTSLVDAGIPCDVIFLDFSKAFDSVDHTILIKKLESSGFPNHIVNWVSSYLSERRQRVSLRGSYSPWVSVLAGVPQGSVLGPLLFNIYMADLPPYLTVGNSSYADDFKLFGPAFNSSLQDSLSYIFSWAKRNHLSLNPSKCVVLHFGHNNPCHNYYLGGNLLSSPSSHRDLGVIIDNKLKFDLHAASVVNSATRKAHYVLKKFIHHDTNLFSLLYKTFIRPGLEYCSQICRPFYSTLFTKLENCQRRLTKWCFPIRHLPYLERLKILNLPTLRDRFDRGDAILTYQLLTKSLDINSSHILTRNFNRTRGHRFKLQGNTARLNCRQHFFSERTVVPWNGLSDFIVSAVSLNSFKSRYDASKL